MRRQRADEGAEPMTGEPVRIAMWSGPRNISTAMMRSFEARGDTAVVDEPYYAAYLQRTGLDHPLREEVIASQSTDPKEVERMLVGPVPGDPAIVYQKHMTLHLLPDFGLGWMAQVRNAFLIRHPGAVLASYAQKRSTVTALDIGFVQQRELFEREADRLGAAPPVIDAADVLGNPAATLGRLCAALGIRFTPSMLHWPAGRRATDGVWAPAWYRSVERSNGFEPPRPTSAAPLPPHLRVLADEAEPHYQALRQHRLA